MRLEELSKELERGKEISETVGRIDALNDQLDALLAQQHRVQSQLLEISVGLEEVKRIYNV